MRAQLLGLQVTSAAADHSLLIVGRRRDRSSRLSAPGSRRRQAVAPLSRLHNAAGVSSAHWRTPNA